MTFRSLHRCYLAAILTVLLVPRTGITQLPDWSDAGLPVKDGLALWLDAAAIPGAPKAAGDVVLADGDPLDRWPDASGNGRHFVQGKADDQPRLVRVGGAWSVRFDGQSDHLRCVGIPGQASQLSLFIVAAPRSNSGNYRGLFATNAPDGRDYQTGLTVGLGRAPSAEFERLNVEGAGFGGERDLLDKSFPMGTLHTIEVHVDRQQQSVRVWIDGAPSGQRSVSPSQLALDQLTVGARYFNNGPGTQYFHGPAHADIVEVLVYDRLLSPDESANVRAYLDEKHARLASEYPGQLQLDDRSIRLVKADQPPAIQMLQSGFTVRELPLALTNVNNVRFREDGRLMTLGYNGDLHLLSDTDGDGLEDHAELFWKNDGSLRGPIGLLLTPPGYPKGRGAFVPSKGKVSLIVDTDGDDRADQEITVASGWQEIPQNVDAVGITMDSEGWIYFGLGTANYANAYLIDQAGKAAYDLSSDRGTVQRVSPDFTQRETVCTGIRFPIAFAFNRHGDLFCSEQEGATWLANGNPFDELLHIQPGRHYGFPPRHPIHNPDVIDEPSTFDFSPQHQSTCGMVLNEPSPGGRIFGPESWSGDAIVCGESRGKIWRTKLVKTDNGYVAWSQLLACLQMLTVDACVAPQGDLVVACHSGPPDWGTGPSGIGKLFRIEMSKPAAPRPVATWAESPHEIRVAFDHALDPLRLRHLTERIRVEFGQFVRAGDRFENLVPPYEVVARQSQLPRFELDVASASLTPDRRTLVINTAAMRWAAHYAVTLPRETDQGDEIGTPSGPIPQHPQTDVDFSLNGLQATWESDGAIAESVPREWSQWIPHPDLQVSQTLTAGSFTHDKLWSALTRSGKLKLRTRMNLHHFLRPAVQPGSSLDYTWPSETVTVTFRSSVPLVVEAVGDSVAVNCVTEDQREVTLTASGDSAEWIDVVIALPTGGGHLPELRVAVHTNEDGRPRPLPLDRLFLPWASQRQSAANDNDAPRRIAELEGGNWGRGRRVFHSQAAACFQCHAMDGVGGQIGPDLANLIHRDYASVMRDIVHPSFAINPDYISHHVLTRDGRVLTGVLQTRGGHLMLGDAEGRLTRLDGAEIESMRPADVSVMPTGLDEKLAPDQLRDLMTYLLTPPPQMPLDSPLQAPPLRQRAELSAVLEGSAQPPSTWRPIHIVLVAGKKDHGPGEHDYPAWQVRWGQLLAAAAEVTVEAAWEFPSDPQLEQADVLIFFQKGSWDDQRQAKMDAYLRRGAGAVYIHWAVNGDDRASDFSRRIGLASRGGSIRYRHGPLTLNMHNTDHPIVRNFERLQLYDESYWMLSGNVDDVTLLASSVEDGQSRPQIWTYEKHSGRVFVSIPGHYSWTFDDPLFRVLLLRGIAWTAREPVDRWNELAPLGARLRK